MRVGVLGRTTMLYNTALCLINKGYDIAFIGTCKASPEYKKKETDFEKMAKKYDVPFFCDLNLDSHMEEMKQADVVVSMNWMNIIGERIIRLFPYGVLNAHPGKLPLYRGNACPNWAIINGENDFAVTIHYMQPGELDSGDIIVQRSFPITSETNITGIYEILFDVIPSMFEDALINVINPDFKGIKQEENMSSRCYPRMPRDSFIDWNSSCDEICKNIRASGPPFAGAYTYCNDIKCYIHTCSLEKPVNAFHAYPGQVVFSDKNSGLVKVAAKDGFICFDEIYVEGKKINASEVMKSLRIRLNYSLQDEVYELKKQIKYLRKIIDNQG